MNPKQKKIAIATGIFVAVGIGAIIAQHEMASPAHRMIMVNGRPVRLHRPPHGETSRPFPVPGGVARPLSPLKGLPAPAAAHPADSAAGSRAAVLQAHQQQASSLSVLAHDCRPFPPRNF
ncbi:hypothetical protein JKG47_10105 [Acidithiobacillus sp. MC6.1]|nr:hypothetical protein [Acidithiobacillus sp. MC6.1]